MKRTIWYRTRQFAVLLGVSAAMAAGPALAGQGKSFKGLSSGGSNNGRSSASSFSGNLGSKMSLKSNGSLKYSQNLGSSMSNSGKLSNSLGSSSLNKAKLFNGNATQFKRNQGALLSGPKVLSGNLGNQTGLKWSDKITKQPKGKLSDAVLTGPFNKLPGGGVFQPPKGPLGPIVADPIKPPKGLGPIVANPFPPIVGPVKPPKPIGPIGPLDPIGPIGPVKPPKDPIGPIGPLDPNVPIGPIVEPNPPAQPPVDPNPPQQPPADPPKDPHCPKPPFGWPWFPGFVGNPYPTYCPPTNTVTVVERPVVVEARTVDLQIAEVRLLDAGNALRGPRYRVWIGNAGNGDVTQAFDVALFATDGSAPSENVPYAVERLNGLAAGQTATLDIRLPATANRMGVDANGQAVPFAALYGAADIGFEVTETNEENNSFGRERTQIGLLNAAAQGTGATPISSATAAMNWGMTR